MKTQREKIELKVKEAAESVNALTPAASMLAEKEIAAPVRRHQIQRHQFSSGVALIQRSIDVFLVSISGGLLAFLAVFSTCFMLPGNHSSEIIKILDLSMIAAGAGFWIYGLCALCPIWLGLCMLLLQALSGVYVGQVIVDVLCNSFLLNPQSLGPHHGLLSFLFTLMFTLVPAFALPYYKAALESSPLRRTLGALYSNGLVSDLAGNRLSFAHAWKRAVMDMLDPILYPIAVALGKNYRSPTAWLEDTTGTIYIKRQDKLEEAIIKSREKVKVRYRAFQELEGIFGKDAQNVPKVMQKQDPAFKRAYHAVLALGLVTIGVFLPTVFLAMGACVRTMLLSGGFQSWCAPALITLSHFLEGWPGVFLGMLSGLAMYFVLAACRPTHIELTDKGIRFIFAAMPFYMQDQICPWSTIRQIALEQTQGKASVADHRLVFELNDGKKLRLRLGSIGSVAGKEEILKAVERWAPNTPRSAEVITALQPPCDFSYTELWMEALSAPPKREKLKPLIDGAVLREHQFTVQKMLGVGGQGTAYLADDSLTAQTVVLKEFVLPIYVEVSARRRALETFEKEARLLKELSHPNVVKLVDYFIEDHRAYLVLEHIDGESLRSLVNRSGALSEDKVRELAVQMCEILEYLHSQSPPVVHRDFTPDNLILRKDGTLKLIDFNVAQQTDSSAVSSVVGKPNYLPPEQFRGTPTTQSDIYALGGCMQFLLIGEDPVAILSSNPSLTRSDVSPELSNIVQKATEPEVENRFVNATEILSELRKEALKPAT